MLQIKDLELKLNVRFLMYNSKSPITNDEYNLVIPDYLNSGLYLPDYSLQGNVNGKEYDIYMKGLSGFTTIHEIKISADYGQP
ncbi:hypothetical protein PCC7424_0135 [Gloeothece citriformis PCC 7424]|uniref:Uncharacterized protein n=1 Tax=Gloeothece citriformis (strain PCC 7424) TaxID=65393 RepID=B7K9C2_GLOC7|nr:hypothetical protein [Gloeothece citriformis]ACK68605.1 hypothetical protein PCC7424_0135 [Gloeothece citriformis PCC 7424]